MEHELELPKGAKILSVQFQHGEFQLWAEVDLASTELEKRTIKFIATGHPFIPDGLVYIGTVQQNSGAFIWHIYEVVK